MQQPIKTAAQQQQYDNETRQIGRIMFYLFFIIFIFIAALLM